MSWLGDLFGGGDDKVSAYLEQQRFNQQRADAEAARQRDEAAAEATRQENIRRRGQAVDTSRSGAASYLQSLGLDPSQFQGDIDQRVNEALSYTAEDDPNVGAYLGDLGKQIYDTREGATRSKALRDVNLTFAPDYETSRISDTLDDPILGTIQNEQRSKADEYVNNLVKRGVINASGQAAANKNLDEQSARVKTVLDELGRSSLESGRSKLGDVANRARQTASTLTLGNTFDPSKYTSEADQDYNDFVSNLGNNIRSKLPSDLYDTSRLASVAGGAQSAQNLKFDPNALAGIIKPDDQNAPTDDPNDPKKRVVF